MTVLLNKNIVEELVTFKLRHLQENIQKILDKWNQENTDDFIKKANTGELEHAERDAITVRQLVKDIERLQKLLNKVAKGK